MVTKMQVRVATAVVFLGLLIFVVLYMPRGSTQPSSLLVELPNGSWIDPNDIATVRVMDGNRVSISLRDGDRTYLHDLQMADLVEAKAKAAELARLANESRAKAQ